LDRGGDKAPPPGRSRRPKEKSAMAKADVSFTFGANARKPRKKNGKKKSGGSKGSAWTLYVGSSKRRR
jgi:hypothetical protein